MSAAWLITRRSSADLAVVFISVVLVTTTFASVVLTSAALPSAVLTSVIFVSAAFVSAAITSAAGKARIATTEGWSTNRLITAEVKNGRGPFLSRSKLLPSSKLALLVIMAGAV